MDKVIANSLIDKLNIIPAVSTSQNLGEINPATAAEFASLVKVSTTQTTNATLQNNPTVNVQGTESIANLPPLTTTKDNVPLLASPLLGVLNNLSSQYNKNVAFIQKSVTNALNPEEGLSGDNTLKLQEVLTTTSLSIAVASKVAGSVSNAINQLVKTQ